MRAPQGRNAWKRPAWKGKDPVGCASGQNQCVIAKLTGLGLVDELQAARVVLPHQGVRPVVDVRQHLSEATQQASGLACLQPVEIPGRALQGGGGLPVDLAAKAGCFVEDDWPDPGEDQLLGGPHAGRPSTNHHIAGGHGVAPVSNSMSGWTKVVQARTRRPSAIMTQQSWQAPIRQKPARGSPVASAQRSRVPWVRMAVSTVSPSRAWQGRPSMVKVTWERGAL